jgi:hypothetical protein
MGIDTGFNIMFFSLSLLLICLFGTLTLLFGFLLTDSAEAMFSDWRKQVKSRQINWKIRLLILVPLLIIFLGAIIVRFAGHLWLVYSVTMVICMVMIISISNYWRKYSEALSEEEKGYILTAPMILTLIIPFTVNFFLFLLLVCGFDIDKIKRLI